MRERLEQYLALTERYNQSFRGLEYSEKAALIDQEAQKLQPTVEKILAALDPKLAEGFMPVGYINSECDRQIRQALGILDDWDEWAKRLAPDAPSLVADRMHPAMWAAASSVWSTGEYKLAVHNAASVLAAGLKKRTASSLNDRDLVKQIFSQELPKPGQVRLHIPGNPEDRTWQSRQQGLHLLAQGAFAGIRNVAVHDQASWTEQEALEHLAVLSVVARWADQAVLVKPE